MDFYFHNVFKSKQAFRLLKLNTAYNHFLYLGLYTYIPIHFNITVQYSYNSLVDFYKIVLARFVSLYRAS
jgi:hypothetical protein